MKWSTSYSEGKPAPALRTHGRDGSRFSSLANKSDPVMFVLVQAEDGPVFVPHTRSEYARLMDGVDIEASWAACAPLEETEQEAP